jgi:hypothetical protein
MGLAALLMSLVVALSAHAGAQRARAANFPLKGKVVPGRTIGGVAVGMSGAAVRARWGASYTVCRSCSSGTVWLYEYPSGDPIGAAVKFVKDKVVAVFTLGSPAGWGVRGVMMGDPTTNVYDLYGSTGTANCIGYDALIVRAGGATTSFYSASGVIYGFALTARSQSPCQ